MKKESFGSIIYNGKMINLDTSNVSDLEKMKKDLYKKEKNLKEKIVAVFKQ